MSEDGTWDAVLAQLFVAAEDAGIIDWAGRRIPRSLCSSARREYPPPHRGWIELRESRHRAA